MQTRTIGNINKCINGRIDYPIRCSNGCIIHPNTFRGYNLSKKSEKEHFYEILHLIKNKLKCKKI